MSYELPNYARRIGELRSQGIDVRVVINPIHPEPRITGDLSPFMLRPEAPSLVSGHRVPGLEVELFYHALHGPESPLGPLKKETHFVDPRVDPVFALEQMAYVIHGMPLPPPGRILLDTAERHQALLGASGVHAAIPPGLAKFMMHHPQFEL